MTLRVICAACAMAMLAMPAYPAAAQVQDAPFPRDSLIAAARDLMEAVRYGALITLDPAGHPRVRTMDPFAPDSDMVVWLGTSRLTRKVEEIRNDPRVTLYYADPGGDGYVAIYGTARLVDDPLETARRWKDEWGRFYPDREATYILIAVQPLRMEIIRYSYGIDGDAVTWQPPGVPFEHARSRAEGHQP